MFYPLSLSPNYKYFNCAYFTSINPSFSPLTQSLVHKNIKLVLINSPKPHKPTFPKSKPRRAILKQEYSAHIPRPYPSVTSPSPPTVRSPAPQIYRWRAFPSSNRPKLNVREMGSIAVVLPPRVKLSGVAEPLPPKPPRC